MELKVEEDRDDDICFQLSLIGMRNAVNWLQKPKNQLSTEFKWRQSWEE